MARSSQVAPSVKYATEPVNLNEGITLLKGRVSTSDVFGASNSDLIPGKYEGGLKLWECSLDLIKSLALEIQNGQLSLEEKKVLEIGCGHGLPGIFTYLKGAATVHFQDFNAEVLQCLTIPNVKANLSSTPSNQCTSSGIDRDAYLTTDVRFFSGDWSEVHNLLSVARDAELFGTRDSSLKQESSGGYDIILMAETVYSLSSLQKLYNLIKMCLCWPNGLVYLAAKKHYFGVGGGTRQFRSIVDHDGVLVASLVMEVADGASNVREVWKFSFK
ncbi:histidine protein methyltransferase 1 homolog isoform X2 [Amborella trichopoda]|uniref:histidine protein methyltransferase 1 homolog isoform X2 n=1 Tax=Amborella trichopoda TaxID=13333 RepID=UPI0009BD6476|nr:histidine protein methyltransferase 1 homolog isoform X2 [Amborella trichopoda]|eukprot:XP_020521277.1 histidine protein methyltransferase 1 homolog isoform X2 [Amborella trichopoda]